MAQVHRQPFPLFLSQFGDHQLVQQTGGRLRHHPQLVRPAGIRNRNVQIPIGNRIQRRADPPDRPGNSAGKEIGDRRHHRRHDQTDQRNLDQQGVKGRKHFFRVTFYNHAPSDRVMIENHRIGKAGFPARHHDIGKEAVLTGPNGGNLRRHLGPVQTADDGVRINAGLVGHAGPQQEIAGHPVAPGHAHQIGRPGFAQTTSVVHDFGKGAGVQLKGDIAQGDAILGNDPGDNKGGMDALAGGIGLEIAENNAPGLRLFGTAQGTPKPAFRQWTRGKGGGEIRFLGLRIDVVKLGIEQKDVVQAQHFQHLAHGRMKAGVLHVIDLRPVAFVQNIALTNRIGVGVDIGAVQHGGRVFDQPVGRTEGAQRTCDLGRICHQGQVYFGVQHFFGQGIAARRRQTLKLLLNPGPAVGRNLHNRHHLHQNAGGQTQAHNDQRQFGPDGERAKQVHGVYLFSGIG